MQVKDYPFKAFSAEEISNMPFAVVQIADNAMVIGHFVETNNDWVIQLEFGFKAVQVGEMYKIIPITDTSVFAYGGYSGGYRPFQCLPMCEEQFLAFMLDMAVQREFNQFLKRMGVGLN